LFLFVFLLKREFDIWKSLFSLVTSFSFLTIYIVWLSGFFCHFLWIHYQYIKLGSFLHPQFLRLMTTLLATDPYI
jgi:hypothetical protein